MRGQFAAPAGLRRVLGIGRASAYRASRSRRPRYARADDRVVTAQIRAGFRTRASHGARPVWAWVNREFTTGYNLKRIRRVMELAGWKLPRATRRRTGRGHMGLIQREVSNERWCSDVLEIACWNGEIVQVGLRDCAISGVRIIIGGQPMCYRIRDGRNVPHPRHWDALLAAAKKYAQTPKKVEPRERLPADTFSKRVAPYLANVPARAVVEATRVSEAWVSRMKRGTRDPAPAALACAACLD